MKNALVTALVGAVFAVGVIVGFTASDVDRAPAPEQPTPTATASNQASQGSGSDGAFRPPVAGPEGPAGPAGPAPEGTKRSAVSSGRLQ